MALHTTFSCMVWRRWLIVAATRSLLICDSMIIPSTRLFHANVCCSDKDARCCFWVAGQTSVQKYCSNRAIFFENVTFVKAASYPKDRVLSSTQTAGGRGAFADTLQHGTAPNTEPFSSVCINERRTKRAKDSTGHGA